jgi:hypothetical protein
VCVSGGGGGEGHAAGALDQAGRCAASARGPGAHALRAPGPHASALGLTGPLAWAACPDPAERAAPPTWVRVALRPRRRYAPAPTQPRQMSGQNSAPSRRYWGLWNSAPGSLRGRLSLSSSSTSRKRVCSSANTLPSQRCSLTPLQAGANCVPQRGEGGGGQAHGRAPGTAHFLTHCRPRLAPATLAHLPPAAQPPTATYSGLALRAVLGRRGPCASRTQLPHPAPPRAAAGTSRGRPLANLPLTSCGAAGTARR